MLGQKFLCVVGALILVLSPSTSGYPIEELKKEADRLRVLYEMALQQEVQSESDTNPNPVNQEGNAYAEGRERLYAEHESVSKPYHEYTDEERKKAELLHILEIAKLMGRDIVPVDEEPTSSNKKNSQPGNSNNVCFDSGALTDGNQVRSMTSGDLLEIIDAMYQVFDLELPTNKHYIAAYYGLNLVSDSSQEFGLQIFFDYYRLTNMPDEIWMTNTPCPRCAKLIMSQYERKDSDDKPTIYFANVTVGATLNETVESFKCMARMVHEGFKLEVWDWEEFRGNLSTTCQAPITTALDNQGFVDAQSTLKHLLEYIHNTSTSSHIMSWCPPLELV